MSGNPEPATHDFGPGRRGWGHDYTITQVLNKGQHLRASGWGHDGRDPIQVGDYLLLEDRAGQRTTRYQVEKIQYERDPSDMWNAHLIFAPRTYASQAEKDNTR